ncbi:DUF2461 domain-containing protein [Candidatus Neomarinimicrobiota bacterium]
MVQSSPFTVEIFDFLRDLKANNNKVWFEANKDRYHQYGRDEMVKALIELQADLSTFAPQIEIIPKTVGGSLHRIYRDLRFSKDKTPYKTHLLAHLRHRQREKSRGLGFYLHIEPEGSIVAGGIWHLEPKDALLVRKKIVDHPDRWEAATRSPGFLRLYGSVNGEQLQRVPKEFDDDHKFAADLKRKAFGGMAYLTDDQILGPDCIPLVVDYFKTATPIMHFMADVFDLPW